MTTYKHLKLLDAWKFIGLVFIITWLIWLIPVLNSLNVISVDQSLNGIFMIAGTFTPSLLALILGKKYNERYLHRAFDVRFKLKWHIFIFTIIPVVAILAHLINFYIFNESTQNFPFLKKPYEIPFVFLISLFLLGPLNEELGWRGYIRDRFLTRYNPLMTSLIIGVVWNLWHLPAFFVIGAPQKVMPYHLFLITNITTTIIMIWIQMYTRGSIFGPLVIHTWINTIMEVLPLYNTQTGSNSQPWLIANVLLVIFCFVIIAKDPRFTGKLDISDLELSHLQDKSSVI